MAKITTAAIKKRLFELTKVPVSRWSRWAKYKVGSPADMQPPSDPSWGFCKGLQFGKHYPQIQGATARLYGCDSDSGVNHCFSCCSCHDFKGYRYWSCCRFIFAFAGLANA